MDLLHLPLPQSSWLVPRGHCIISQCQKSKTRFRQESVSMQVTSKREEAVPMPYPGSATQSRWVVMPLSGPYIPWIKVKHADLDVNHIFARAVQLTRHSIHCSVKYNSREIPEGRNQKKHCVVNESAERNIRSSGLR